MTIVRKYPAQGAERTVCGFVIWKTIGLETRILQRAAWKEVYIRPCPIRKGYWHAVMWLPYHPIV